jgi:hypothetical protein
MKEAPARLEQEGWAKVRPAISLSVRLVDTSLYRGLTRQPYRAYLLRGMFVAGMTGNAADAERLQGEAIKILEWGAQKWANVPTSERGAVFTPTFIRGCKSMQLENYMGVGSVPLADVQLLDADHHHDQAFCKNPGPGKQPYSLDGLHDFAQEQLRETRANPPDLHVTRTPGFIMAFHTYPEAHALTWVATMHTRYG